MWDFLMGLLPTSLCPFSSFIGMLESSSSGFANVMRQINWFIPISDMIVILELWGTAILVWYAASVLLRTVNAIQ